MGIKNFLTNSQHKVVIQEEETKWADIASRIPQGSVLWQILFLIYINDLLDVVKHIEDLT